MRSVSSCELKVSLTYFTLSLFESEDQANNTFQRKFEEFERLS